jgi:hypothetical protein
MRGFPRDGTQFHAGFVQSTVTFLVIASDARSDKIFPCVFPSKGFRLYMVDSERGAGASAVLAAVSIATKHILPRKKNSFVGDAFKMSQFNDAWVGIFGGDGTN